MPKTIKENLTKVLAAEFLGTFILVFGGVGAVTTNALSKGSLGHIGISLAFGLALMVGIYALGHLSGAHFNPAVTLGLTLTKHFPRRKLLQYWAAQILGAVVASLAVNYLIGLVGSGVTQPVVAVWPAFVIEIILTFILMVVIMAVGTDSRAVNQAAGVAIGGTIALEALFAGPLTGASMNPARSIGPALVSGNLDHLWLYILAPLIGASLGALFYEKLRHHR